MANIGSNSTDRRRTIRNSARRITQIIKNGFETEKDKMKKSESKNELKEMNSRPELDYINATSKMDYWERDQGRSLDSL